MVCGKKGQVTLFVIMGIIILLVAGVFLYSGDNNQNEGINNVLDGRSASLEDYVRGCMSNVAEDAVMQITLQGGYHKLQEPYFDAQLIQTPYYLEEGLFTHVPTIETVEENLASYMFMNLNSCVGNFEGVKNYELINFSAPRIEAHVEETGVTFVVDYDAWFNDGDNLIELPAVSYRYPSRIPTYLNISNQITEEYLYGRNVDYDLILNLAEEYDLEVMTFQSGESVMIIMLIDDMEEYYFEEDKPVVYTFAIEGGLL